MAEFVAIVDFEVSEENAEAFAEAALENARQSVELEPGCRRFDVVRYPDDNGKITFFEVFDDAAAFDAHATFAHAAAFGAAAKQFVLKATPRKGELFSDR